MPFETAGNIENRAFLIGYIVMLLGLFWQVLEKKIVWVKKLPNRIILMFFFPPSFVVPLWMEGTPSIGLYCLCHRPTGEISALAQKTRSLT